YLSTALSPSTAPASINTQASFLLFTPRHYLSNTIKRPGLQHPPPYMAHLAAGSASVAAVFLLLLVAPSPPLLAAAVKSGRWDALLRLPGAGGRRKEHGEHVGTRWAVLIAGSNGYENYRHQADICHAYQILKSGGLNDENIIVFMYDDIASNKENPRPGIIINHPQGKDVYAGVPKDYTGDDVNANNFLAVLLGNRSALTGGSGKVLESGPNDRVFIYYADQGASGVLAMPNGYLLADDLVDTLKKMHDSGSYESLVFYIEASESGSIFQDLLPDDIRIYATTAANAEESSWATYCPGADDLPPEYDTCLGDLYSVSWMEDSEENDLSNRTLQQQYEAVIDRTTGWSDHQVLQFGDISLSEEYACKYLGSNLAKKRNSPLLHPRNYSPGLRTAVKQRDADLVYFWNKLMKSAEGSAQKLEAQKQLLDALSHRLHVDNSVELIGTILFGSEQGREKLKAVRAAGQPLVEDWGCLRKMVRIFETYCGSLNQYGMRHMRAIANICNAGISKDVMAAAASQACGRFPTNPRSSIAKGFIAYFCSALPSTSRLESSAAAPSCLPPWHQRSDPASPAMARPAAASAFLLLLLLSVLVDSRRDPLLRMPTDVADELVGTRWAVLIAGSNGYGNYRHQADVCHAYQVVKRGGLKDENIIVFMYDDIAYNEENPRPGIIINHPEGEDVYAGVPKDYVGDDVTVNNFFAVLLGNKSALTGGSGKVVDSGPDDHIFIYYSDHGGPGMPTFPYLYASDLVDVLKRKHASGSYKSLVFYLESCESGSMFEGLLPEGLNVYATTASNAEESSWGTYCPGDFPSSPPEYGTCLGDLYSVTWMEDSDIHDLRTETLLQQYHLVRDRTSNHNTYTYGSHVMQYGDLYLSLEYLFLFIGSNPANDNHTFLGSNSLPSFSRAVNQRDADLLCIWNKFRKSAEGSPSKLEAQKQLLDVMSHRFHVDNSIELIGNILFGVDKGMQVLKNVRSAGKPLVDDWSCLKTMVRIFETHCGSLSQYGMKHMRGIANICNEGISEDTMTAAASEACDRFPSNPLSSLHKGFSA
ncbi:hypothetical protein Taro_012674, partial [Colocasia esculenta]|nr:hypothetical protein [Colocasia esculenta]